MTTSIESGGSAATTPSEPSPLSYEDCLRQYQKFREAMAMTKPDPELATFYIQALEGAVRCAAQLHALLYVTTGVDFRLRKEGDPFYRAPSEGAENSNTVVVYPPPGRLTLNTPFEVHYDNREWLPCVLLQVKPYGASPATDPSSAQQEDEAEEERVAGLWRCTVGILGYNVILEEVSAALLRPYDAAAALKALESGLRASAVHPDHYGFAPCVVQRLTLSGTVMVQFDGTTGSSVEVPLCHVRLGRVHKELRPTRQLSAEEKRERREQAARQKRQRAIARVEEGAKEWTSALNDLVIPSESSAKKSTRKGLKR